MSVIPYLFGGKVEGYKIISHNLIPKESLRSKNMIILDYHKK
jgi:hypothetical protein